MASPAVLTSPRRRQCSKAVPVRPRRRRSRIAKLDAPIRAAGRAAWLDVAVAGAAPGVLLGALLAGLLFFLNPQLPFAFSTVGRAVALYGGLLGAASLVAHLPFTWGRRRRARRAVPWAITAVLAAMAVYDWSHASHYAYYLPPGINQRLTKAGVFLAVGGLVSFYTALLHTLARRPYGARSRVLYFCLTGAAIYVQIERREAFRPRPPVAPRPALVESSQRPRLIVVGIEAATLDAVLPLAEQDRLPFFSSLLQEGAYGRLQTLVPTRRPTLWTTLATGKLPFKHSILGRERYPAPFLGEDAELWLLPRGLSFPSWGTLGTPARQVSAADRRERALWEILAALGGPTGVIGWPVSSPAPRRLAFALPDRFFADPGAPDAGYPPALAERAAALRVELEALPPALRQELGTGAASATLRAAAHDQWRQAVILAVAADQPQAEALFADLPGLQNIARRYFGGYSAVHLDGQHDAPSERAARVVELYYTQLDAFLAELWRQAGPGTLLAVVSAFGVDGPTGWEKLRGLSEQARMRGGFERGPDGLLLLRGAGIRPGLLPRARVVDVVPTLLYGLGLPAARDLDGRALTEAFTGEFLAAHPLNFVPSYEALEQLR